MLYSYSWIQRVYTLTCRIRLFHVVVTVVSNVSRGFQDIPAGRHSPCYLRLKANLVQHLRSAIAPKTGPSPVNMPSRAEKLKSGTALTFMA